MQVSLATAREPRPVRGSSATTLDVALAVDPAATALGALPPHVERHLAKARVAMGSLAIATQRVVDVH